MIEGIELRLKLLAAKGVKIEFTAIEFQTATFVGNNVALGGKLHAPTKPAIFKIRYWETNEILLSRLLTIEKQLEAWDEYTDSMYFKLSKLDYTTTEKVYCKKDDTSVTDALWSYQDKLLLLIDKDNLGFDIKDFTRKFIAKLFK